MNTNKWKIWINRIKDISIIVTCLSIIITAFQSRASWRQTKLANYSETKDFIESEYDIRKKINYSLQTYSNMSSHVFSNHSTGRSLLYSNNPDIMCYKEIGHHFEQVGALIKRGYLDFDLYSDIFDFPDKYWKRTKALTYYIRTHWDNDKDNPIFEKYLCNFEYLQKRYKEKRRWENFWHKFL